MTVPPIVYVGAAVLPELPPQPPSANIRTTGPVLETRKTLMLMDPFVDRIFLEGMRDSLSYPRNGGRLTGFGQQDTQARSLRELVSDP
jgi:hypothetical protein